MTEISLQQFREIANQEFQRSTAVQSTEGKLRFSETDKAWAVTRSDDDKLKNMQIRKAFLNAITRETGVTVENLPQAVKDALNIGDYDLNEQGAVRSTKPLTAYRIQVVLDELSNAVQNSGIVLKNTDYSVEDSNLSINDKESSWEAINQKLEELHKVTDKELVARFKAKAIKKKAVWTKDEWSSVSQDAKRRYRAGAKATASYANGIYVDTGNFNVNIQFVASVKKCVEMGDRKVNRQSKMQFPWTHGDKAKIDTTKLIPMTVGDLIDNFPELLELNRCLLKACKICEVCALKLNMSPELNKMCQDLMDKALDLIGKITVKHPRGKDTYLNFALNTLVKNVMVNQSNIRSEIASLEEKPKPKLPRLQNGDKISLGPNNQTEEWKAENYHPRPEKSLDFEWVKELEKNQELDITEMDWLEDEAETLQKKARQKAESSQAAKELLTDGTFDRIFQKLQEAEQLAKTGVPVDCSEIKSQLKTIEDKLKVK